MHLGLDTADDLIATGNFKLEGGASGAHHLLSLDHPPPAIFASSDTETFGVMQVARNKGLTIPRDLSLVGFDDIP